MIFSTRILLSLEWKSEVAQGENRAFQPVAGFRRREALGYSTCEALPNSPPSQLEEDGSVLNKIE